MTLQGRRLASLAKLKSGVGADGGGLANFIIKGAYPYTDYTDKGNVIDAGEGDDWVSAGWANDSVHGGDDKDVIHGLAGPHAGGGLKAVFWRMAVPSACAARMPEPRGRQ